MRTSKISEKLEPLVLAKAGEGLSSRQISAWLSKEHKVKVGHAAVNRFLKERRTDRREVAKAVVAEKLSQTITSDLDVIDEELQRARRIAEKAGERAVKLLDSAASGELVMVDDGEGGRTLAEPPDVDKAVDTYRKVGALVTDIANKKLQFSGAGNNEDGNGLAGLFAKLDESDGGAA